MFYKPFWLFLEPDWERIIKSLNILYVEDNQQIRDTVCELLEGDSRKITAFANAEDALVAFAKNSFDVVMTDISLPGLSGTDFARRVLAAQPAQWVVLCSGYAMPPNLTNLGPNVRSLLKPFELEELESLLDKIAIAMTDSTLGRKVSAVSACAPVPQEV